MVLLDDVNTSIFFQGKEERTYTIAGVKVRFPYQPYPSQMAMMSKVKAC